MLSDLRTVLASAKKEKRSVGSFNVYSYETIEGVIAAGQKCREDVIVSFGSSYLKNMSLDQVFFLVNDMSKDSLNRVVLHLDHCEDFEIIKRAIDAGFTSVMYDGSSLSFEENLKNTCKVCQMAHEKNVSVEAELGSLSLGEFSNETDIDHGQEYTDPRKAREFAQRTKVDALAVSIGTVHGMYKAKPNIRIDILKEIANMVELPLVLHGGSGTPKEILTQCINNGICKINVNTEISRYAIGKIKETINENPGVHLSTVSLLEIKFVEKIVEKYIGIFKNGLLNHAGEGA